MQHFNIIGGSGFIGSRLCQRLSNSIKPFKIIDKASSEAFPENASMADIRSLNDLRECIEDRSVLINLAAEHRDDVQPISLYDETNVDGARNLCKVATEKNVKTIIFTSSVSVYGFAPIGTDENGVISPFNDYGRTKYLAEQIFHNWQAKQPLDRTLVIIRPTVVFGENNRGNVYNLLRQIASGKFVMIGNGKNRKSMAYVENLAAFIDYSASFAPGVHIYNYVDKPDFTMLKLVTVVKRALGKSERTFFKVPFIIAYPIGKCFDILAMCLGKRFAISSIRIKKFCSNSVYKSAISSTEFKPPFVLEEALKNTIEYEFKGKN